MSSEWRGWSFGSRGCELVVVTGLVACGPQVAIDGGTSATEGSSSGAPVDLETSGQGAVDTTETTGDPVATALACAWSVERMLVVGDLEHVSAHGANDIWICADDGFRFFPDCPDVLSCPGPCMHWNGRRWTTVLPPWTVGTIWGSSGGDLWAASAFPWVDSPPAVQHYDGVEWTAPPIPDRESAVYQLHGTGPSDVWATGELTTLLHWDGAAWTNRFAETGAGNNAWNEYRIWAEAPDDVYLLRASWGDVRHYDGRSWTELAAPPSAGIPDVWALDGSVYLVTWYGIVYRHDAGEWTQIAPAFVETATGPLRLRGEAADRLWVEVRDADDHGGTLMGWDGTTWAAHDLDLDTVDGMWASTDGLVRAGRGVDECGRRHVVRASAAGREIEWSWHDIRRPAFIDPAGRLHAFVETEVASGDRDVARVGPDGTCTIPELRGTLAVDEEGTRFAVDGERILKFSGDAVEDIGPSGFSQIDDGRASQGRLWVTRQAWYIGCAGTHVARWSDGQWTHLGEGSCLSLIDAAAGQVWLAGARPIKGGRAYVGTEVDGALQEFEIPLEPSDDETWLSGLAATDGGVFVAALGQLWFFDGELWTRIDGDDGFHLETAYGVDATSASDVYVVGETAGESALWHFDGATWAAIPLDDRYTEVLVDGSGHVAIASRMQLRYGDCVRSAG